MQARISKLRFNKGFDLPIAGPPAQVVEVAPPPRSVALLGADLRGVRVSLHVEVGDRVRVGQPLFADRRNPSVRFCSPASGTVAAVHRGDARSLTALEIEVSGTESVEFPRVGLAELRLQTREQTTQRLLQAGDWLALRARPFGTIATPGSAPAAIFIRAMDSNPLAADAAVVLRDRLQDLEAGLTALSHLSDGPLYLCSRPGAVAAVPEVGRLELIEVTGPHPAGLVGTHVHHLSPASRDRRIWYIGYQDVLAIGQLFLEGRPDPSRVISLAGPAIRRPRLIRTPIGSSSEELIEGELRIEECRIIAGSVLSGRVAVRPGAFLGRYDEQLCAIPLRAPRPFRGWWVPSWRRLRSVPRWSPQPAASNELHGEPNAFCPLDVFDRAFPLRFPVSPLLRALASGDASAAESFGALELEEEDLALCSYLCPAKLEYGPLLRALLAECAEQLP